MKIEIEVSEKNEGTDSPWWAILDPEQNMSCGHHALAAQITGPFFSREDAQRQMDVSRHNYGMRAVVYCLSGCHSRAYKNALRRSNG